MTISALALALALGLVTPARNTAARPLAASGLCVAADNRVVVDVAAHKLALCERRKEIATFGVRLGRGGTGKTKEGDGRTPLGVYELGAPRPSEHYGIFIPIGYPTAEQRQRGFTGGAVGVHGPHRFMRWLGALVNTFDSSDGCVGIATDADIETIATWVKAAKAHTIELE